MKAFIIRFKILYIIYLYLFFDIGALKLKIFHRFQQFAMHIG